VRIISFSWLNAPAGWTHVAGRSLLMPSKVSYFQETMRQN
jgi:hypothetical protein